MLDALKDKLKVATNLPTPPTIAQAIIALANEPEVDLAEISAVIAKDPGLSAKLLRVANSPMYSRGRQSDNLRQALVRLGLNAATTLALSFSLAGTYRSCNGSGVDYPHYWRRAVLGASAARTFGQLLSVASSDALFLGALLQDVGVIAIDRAQPQFYGELSPHATHTEVADYERNRLGVDHARLTGWLLRHWKLPEPLCQMAEASHDPTGLDRNSPLGIAGRCVALGSECVEVLLATEGRAAWSTLAALAKSWLDISPPALSGALDTLIAEIPEIERLFDTKLLDPSGADIILEQARELLTLRSLQAIEHVTSLRESSEQLRTHAAELEDKNRRDPLTGLYNRRHLDETVAKEFQSAAAGGWPLSVVFVDLDRFKAVNDTYGHAAGDAVLIETARLLLEVVRETDCVARYGGEEFVIILPGLEQSVAEKVCGRLLSTLRLAEHPVAGGNIRSTASLGLATYSPVTPFPGVAALIEAADRSVYAAKARGRDQLVCFDRAAVSRSA